MMMIRRVMTSVMVASVLATGAFASWNVTVLNSSGVLNPPSTPVQVPVLMNLNGPYFAPSPTVTVNALPQVTFLTAAASPQPDTGRRRHGISPTAPSRAAYTITPVSGSHAHGLQLRDFRGCGRQRDDRLAEEGHPQLGQRASSTTTRACSRVRVSAARMARSASVIPVTLAAPANDVTVFENFLLFVLPSSPTSTAGLLLVEQDWVPEPASMIALSSGLVGLLALRRRKR
jgi:hypothetical protein